MRMQRGKDHKAVYLLSRLRREEGAQEIVITDSSVPSLPFDLFAD